MAIYFGIDSNYASQLFSSLNTSEKSGMSNLLADYAGIKNGSYGKLLDKYYSLNSESTNKKTSTSLSTSKDNSKVLTAVESSAEQLKSTADSLMKSGTDSVFAKVQKKDENGSLVRAYDTDKIYKGVEKFVEDYNSVISNTEKSNTSSIASQSAAMIKTTIANRNMLSSIGISMDTDGKLSISEETFKSADMSKVKSMFQGAGSYAYQISAKASMIDYYAERESSKANTYTNTGKYSYNYSAGDLYNSLF